MTTDLLIHPRIAAHIDAALAADFTIYAQPSRDGRPVGHVYVCKEWDGPFALIQVPTMALDPVQLDVPIEPHREYGSGVLVDHDGTPEDAVRALTAACSEPTVTVRFMSKPYVAQHGTPKVPNYGNKALTKYGKSLDATVKLGERGSNWSVRQQAGRLEVGDRFDSALETGEDRGILTVTGRRFGGFNYETVFLAVAELDEPVEFPINEVVTLEGAL